MQKMADIGVREAPSIWIPHRPDRPVKSEGGRRFKLVSEFEPKGDQPNAIKELCEGLAEGERDQVLLGVTGSGKTFTMAKIIEQTQRPALILAPNKTLAAQLYGEFKNFFPENAVEYFVSYYDYYQPEAYVARTMTIDVGVGQDKDSREFMGELVALQYQRNDLAFQRGTFRVRGDTVEIFPAHYDDMAWRIDFFGDEIDSIVEFDPLTGKSGRKLDKVRIYANSHYVTPRPTVQSAIKGIKAELAKRTAQFEAEGKLLEAQRIAQRTEFDLEMLAAQGFCTGIENYSRYLTGRAPGEPPPTMFEYLPENALLFTDESHVSVSQIGAMSKGDANRNPTGLIDPPVEVRPVAKDGASQVDDVIDEVRKTTARGFRSLVTTLTKKMSEDLTEYMHDQGIRVRYMHSDIDTLERIEIIRDLRMGVFDVLIGINLLREGLDIPECAFVGILDADKEGFLRSETSLVQTIGRAARNSEAKVVLYADRITGSMERAMAETKRRRARQVAHNEKHGITPTTVIRNVIDVVGDSEAAQDIKDEANSYTPSGLKKKGGKKGKATRRILEVADGGQAPFIGANMATVLADLAGCKDLFLPITYSASLVAQNVSAANMRLYAQFTRDIHPTF